nr:hypothetical protein [Tanacetum cinerariifolium]
MKKKTTLVILMMLFLVCVQQAKAGIYTCWGGCLNQCFFLGTINNNRIGTRFPCYVNCVAACLYPPPGSRSSTPPSPPHDAHVPVPSPSDSDDDTTFDNEKYSCITLCSLQTCHGGSDMKNCLTSCIDKCRDGDSGAGDGGYAFWSHGRGFCSHGGQVNDGGIAKLGEGERDGDGDGLGGK